MAMRAGRGSINDQSLGELDLHDYGVATGLDRHEPGAFPRVGYLPGRFRMCPREIAGINFGIVVGIVTGLQAVLAGR